MKSATTSLKVALLLSATSRLLLILIILSFLTFSLDVFDPGDPLGKMIAAFFIHNLSTIALILILILSLRYELAAGILSMAQSIYMISHYGGWSSLNTLFGFLLVGLPFILGVFFVASYFLKRSSAKIPSDNS